MISKQRTVCDPNCHANPKCGLSATVENGRIIAIDPADYPVPGYETASVRWDVRALNINTIPSDYAPH